MHFIPEAEFGIRKKRCSDAVLEIQHLDGRDREVASLRPAWVTQQQKEEEKEPEEEEEEEKEKEKVRRSMTGGGGRSVFINVSL